MALLSPELTSSYSYRLSFITDQEEREGGTGCRDSREAGALVTALQGASFQASQEASGMGLNQKESGFTVEKGTFPVGRPTG